MTYPNDMITNPDKKELETSSMKYESKKYLE